MENSKFQDKIERNIYCGYLENGLSDKDLVQTIELIKMLLNLKTRQQMANQEEVTYNTVKKKHKKRTHNILGEFLVVDNN